MRLIDADALYKQMGKFIELGKIFDTEKALKNREYHNSLYQEFGIKM